MAKSKLLNPIIIDWILIMNNIYDLEKYTDHKGMIGPGGMNTIVYTVQYLMLGGLLNISFMQIIFNHLSDDGSWCNSDGTTPISHDNMTALAILVKRYGSHGKIQFEPQHAYLHPRDFFYYAFMCNSLRWRIIGTAFLWISSLCMIYGVAFDHYKNIDGAKVLATDGKLLTWMRINGSNLPITRFICNQIVKYKGGWSQYFKIYFKDEGHPNRVMAIAQNL